MARTSKAEKAKTHEKLLEIASSQLRANGFSGLRVPDVMQAAGMTHGGFYRHFKSKEDLATQATKRAFATFASRLEDDMRTQPPALALDRFLDRYLSLGHVRSLSSGCPIAALGTEAPRCSAGERSELETGTNRIIDLLDGALQQVMNPQGFTGSSILAVLVGTLNLARLQNDPKQQQQLLENTRAQLQFEDTPPC